MRTRNSFAQALAVILCFAVLLPISLRAETGSVIVTYDYDAFGILLHSTGTTPNNYLYSGEQFDPDLGLYYNRARYLNTSTGRFFSMDTDEGDAESPLSLHKYLYVASDPVDLVDPSGHDPNFGDADFGYEVEDEIEPQYEADHQLYDGPFGPTRQFFVFGKWCKLGGSILCAAYRLKPDILNISLMQWLEIKPLSLSGVPRAAAAWTLYSGALGPFGFNPDPIWIPKIQPLFVYGRAVWVFNLNGILFYTTDPSKQQQAIKVLVGVTSVIAALTLLKVIGDFIPPWTIEAVEGAYASLQTQVGLSTVVAAEGGG